jgi:hypothetical protein
MKHIQPYNTTAEALTSLDKAAVFISPANW